MIVSDPESDGADPISTHLVEVSPLSEIPIERTCDAKINSMFQPNSTRFGEATNPSHRKLSLNVADRSRIEEFGKQEIFVEESDRERVKSSGLPVHTQERIHKQERSPGCHLRFRTYA